MFFLKRMIQGCKPIVQTRVGFRILENGIKPAKVKFPKSNLNSTEPASCFADQIEVGVDPNQQVDAKGRWTRTRMADFSLLV